MNDQLTKSREALVALLKKFQLDTVHVAPSAEEAADGNFLQVLLPNRRAYVKQAGQAVSLDQEVQSWMAEKTQNFDVEGDRVVFWRERGSQWPRLQKLAERILPVPISAAESERTWSSAGFISGVRRSNMSPEVMEATLLVSTNTATQAKLRNVDAFGAMTFKKSKKRE